MKQYLIDFAPGLHGHFLEYVINRYVFSVEPQLDSIFQSSGACHPINTDHAYQEDKLITQGHFSSFGYLYPSTVQKIVFVEHDPDLDFILLVNMYYRCHPDSVNAQDFNIKEITQLQESLMFAGSDHEFKNNWYSKLMEHRFEHADKQPSAVLPMYRFKYSSFFDLYKFLLELRNTADFLEHTFSFDPSLILLWTEFIDRNQGYSLWTQGNTLFENIASGTDAKIDNDWKLHAYLNYKISKVFRLYDHPRLFGAEKYPTTTQEIFDIIVDHIRNFDQHW